MTYKTDIIEYLSDVVDAIDKTVNIVSATTPSAGIQEITVDDIKWIQPSIVLSIGGNDYTVSSISGCVITLIGASAIVVSSFTLPTVHFFHGTVKETNITLTKRQFDTQKTPLVYLLEIFSERFNEDVDEFERVSDLRLFFLTHANFEEWEVDDFYANSIKPMQRLTQHFIDTLNKQVRVQQIRDYELTNLSRFGVYVNNKGFESTLFEDKLSGVELRISLELRKPTDCSGCC
jgi:hypothetical protein